MSSKNDLTIIVRCALQSFGDIRVICPPDWTVLRLKEHLRDVCDSHPAPEKQRLICSGRCLTDDKKRLSESLGVQTEGVDNFTVHLVCTPTVDQIRAQKVAAAAKKKAAEEENHLRQRRCASAAQMSAVSNQNNAQNGPTNQNTSQYPAAAFSAAHLIQSPVFLSGAQTGQSVGSPGADAWAQAYQQMYQSYMANYMNYMQQAYGSPLHMASSSQNFQQSVGANLPAPHQHQRNAEPAHIAQPAVAAHVAGNVPQPPLGPDPAIPNAGGAPQVMNVGLGGVNAAANPDGHRDWLEYVYMSIRLGLLVMLLYHYSSFEKCVALVLVIVVVYAFNQGWFGLRGEGLPEPPEADQPRLRENNPVNVRENEAQEAEETVRNDDANEGQEESAWEVFWSTCYIFITSFFASMIPERAPPMNAN